MRENTASMYPTVTDYDIRNVSIPNISIKIQEVVSEYIQESIEKLNNSKKEYK